MTHNAKKSSRSAGFFARYGLLSGIILLFVALIWGGAAKLIALGSFSFTAGQSATGTPAVSLVPLVAHVETPSAVKAIYMTSWVAGSHDLRNKLVSLIEDTEINSVVIDIKDYTGAIAFPVSDEMLKANVEKRAPDMKDFVKELHEKGIYVIGRIAAFQDPLMVKEHPEIAVKKNSDKTAVWKDYKGITWIDAGSPLMWSYLTAIAKEAYSQGFDEINFDYVRFPSDGNMKDIYYPYSKNENKAEVMKNFFSFVHSDMATSGAKLSVDLFGMTTTNSDDLNIGQVLESALPYFDYVSPMVYPSHYPSGFIGLKNPADNPYTVVKYSMDKAVARAIEFASSTSLTASSSERYSTTSMALKLRPWLQDFNLGAVYTAGMVKEQIRAVYDSKLTSWMLWNASNKYTGSALIKVGSGIETASSTR